MYKKHSLLFIIFYAFLFSYSCGDSLLDSDDKSFMKKYLQFGTIGVSGPCEEDAYCAKGLKCFSPDYAGGICSKICDANENDCPVGSVCYLNPATGRPIPLCFKYCNDELDCNEYSRYSVCGILNNQPLSPVCQPVTCENHDVCPNSYQCVDRGFCQKKEKLEN